jgi:hypothetical protein
MANRNANLPQRRSNNARPINLPFSNFPTYRAYRNYARNSGSVITNRGAALRYFSRNNNNANNNNVVFRRPNYNNNFNNNNRRSTPNRAQFFNATAKLGSPAKMLPSNTNVANKIALPTMKPSTVAFCEAVLSPFSNTANGALRPDGKSALSIPANDILKLNIKPATLLNKINGIDTTKVVSSVTGFMMVFMPRCVAAGWTSKTLNASAVVANSRYLPINTTFDGTSNTDPMYNAYSLGIVFSATFKDSVDQKELPGEEFIALRATNNPGSVLEIMHEYATTPNNTHYSPYQGKVRVLLNPLAVPLLNHKTQQYFQKAQIIKDNLSVDDNDADDDKDDEKDDEKLNITGFGQSILQPVNLIDLGLHHITEVPARLFNAEPGSVVVDVIPKAINVISFQKSSGLIDSASSLRIIGAGIKLWSNESPLNTGGIMYGGYITATTFAQYFQVQTSTTQPQVTPDTFDSILNFRQVFQGVDGITVRYNSCNSLQQSKLQPVVMVASGLQLSSGSTINGGIGGSDLMETGDHYPIGYWRFKAPITTTTDVTNVTVEAIVRLEASPGSLNPYVSSIVRKEPVYNMLNEALGDIQEHPVATEGHSFKSFLSKIDVVFGQISKGLKKTTEFVGKLANFGNDIKSIIAND